MKIAINKLLDYEQPQKYIVRTENYSDSFSTPVLTAGKSFILGYTDETDGIYKGAESPVIIFDDFTSDKKYVDFDFKVKSSAMKLLHKVNTSDNLKYLFYALQSIKYTPFSHKRIWISEYSNFLIEYRHHQEQNAIVLALDGINQAIYNKKQELSSLDELVKSRFIEMFENKGFSFLPFSKYADIIDGDRGKNYPKATDFSDNGYCLFLNAKNVIKEGFSFEQTQFISKEKDAELRKGKLQRKDIVITTRGTIGNIAYYDETIPYDNIRINSGMVIIRPQNISYNPFFFLYAFRNKVEEIKAQNVTGAAQPQLPIHIMSKIQLLNPPIELQNEFAEFVKLIDKSKFVCHSKNFLCDIFTFSSSTIAYPSVVSIFVCPKRC